MSKPEARFRAILFDSGRTLARPRSGHWFIPPGYRLLFDQELRPRYGNARLEAAFRHGHAYLDDHHHLQTESEELAQFKTFYTIFFKHLNYPAGEDLILGLAEESVFNDDKYEFYPDCFDLLPGLAEHYLLGIVSDAWPSLERVYINQGLRGYFSSFVISARLGSTKPRALNYQVALAELEVTADETVFVDDNLRCLEGAAALGIQPVLIDRDHRIPHNFLRFYGFLRPLFTKKSQKSRLETSGLPFPRICGLADLLALLNNLSHR
ncbi:MAG TPA: HAD-IA family hydrolase [Anaerolineaceae bacterium]